MPKGATMAMKVAEGRAEAIDFAPFLTSKQHPLLKGAKVLTIEQLGDVLIEFAFFSQALPKLLSLARKACPGDRYAQLRAEIELNLREELGLEGAKEPYVHQSHYSILRSQTLMYLGRDPDLEAPRQYTRQFLTGLTKVVAGGGPTTYGALLALEATAVPEISAMREMITRTFKPLRLDWTPTLTYFFDAHVSKFEVDHYNRLRELFRVVASNQSELAKTDSAFRRVATLMCDWYEALSAELE